MAIKFVRPNNGINLIKMHNKIKNAIKACNQYTAVCSVVERLTQTTNSNNSINIM